MLRLDKILFPVDFSEGCVATGLQVKALAEEFHSEIVLLFAMAPFSAHVAALDVSSLTPESVAGYKEAVKEALAAFLADKLSGIRVHRVLADGYPAEAIVHQASAFDVDLIMMPTRGVGAFRRYVMGSVTAKVLHDANSPVWTGVHHKEAPPFSPEFRNVVCAVDLGPQSLKALGWASGLAEKLHSKLTLLHVVPHSESVAGQRSNRDSEASVVSLARDGLQKMRDSAGAACDVHIEIGEPAKTVIAFAGTLKADLLVIGRSPQDGLIGRLRANAYTVISQASCPVVSV